MAKRHVMTARRRAALRKAQLASARKRRKRYGPSKRTRQVGEFAIPTQGKRGGLSYKRYRVMDSPYNASQRNKKFKRAWGTGVVAGTLAGAPGGPATMLLGAGIGSMVGGEIGLRRGRKYGQTVKPMRSTKKRPGLVFKNKKQAGRWTTVRFS